MATPSCCILHLHGRRCLCCLELPIPWPTSKKQSDLTCAVTAQYNRRMQAILPAYGIHVTEIPRLNAISATTVRARLQEGDVAAVRALVPETTYEACRSLFGAGAPCP